MSKNRIETAMDNGHKNAACGPKIDIILKFDKRYKEEFRNVAVLLAKCGQENQVAGICEMREECLQSLGRKRKAYA
jgi:late competence protein required for DNA uptake (superfamily II DNA/RNA helicase)